MRELVNAELMELSYRRDELLRQLGRDKIGLSLQELAQKKFCNFIRDYGIKSIAHIDYKYKNFRYFLDVENKELKKLLFDHVTVWYGCTDDVDKLYFVSQPYRSYDMRKVEDLLELLLEEKKFLEFCKNSGHRLTLNFDNMYNWRDNEAFMIIIELDNEGKPMDSLDITIIDWGIETVYRYQ